MAMVFRPRFGWTMSIVSVMNRASQSAAMEAGEDTTADILKMWESFANIHQYQLQVIQSSFSSLCVAQFCAFIAIYISSVLLCNSNHYIAYCNIYNSSQLIGQLAKRIKFLDPFKTIPIGV